jgi:hypothetical protein
MFLTHDGNQVSQGEIKEAFESGAATLVHSYGNGKTLTGLSLNHMETDTREESYSVWDAVWTTKPKNLQQAYFYAKV